MKKTMNFLKELKANNNKDWFQKNRSRYTACEQEFKELATEIAGLMNGHDVLEDKFKIFRIYRDVRFSPDKTPYNSHRSVTFKRAGAERRGGYYLRIQPGATVLAGGFWGPEPKDLLHIRKQLQADPQPVRDIIAGNDFRNYFGELMGDTVKSAPKGFSKDDPAIDLLRYKQFLLVHDFSDKEVVSAEFANMVSEGFRRMRPLFDHMSYILTTDLNGESLI